MCSDLSSIACESEFMPKFKGSIYKKTRERFPLTFLPKFKGSIYKKTRERFPSTFPSLPHVYQNGRKVLPEIIFYHLISFLVCFLVGNTSYSMQKHCKQSFLHPVVNVDLWVLTSIHNLINTAPIQWYTRHLANVIFFRPVW